MVGQSCINDVAMWTGWDWSRQRDHPDTVKDELGLACADPDNEAECPKARRCISEEHCHSDVPDWSRDENLQRNFPLGWGADTPPWLNPATDHNWHSLPRLEGYDHHLLATDWA